MDPHALRAFLLANCVLREPDVREPNYKARNPYGRRRIASYDEHWQCRTESVCELCMTVVRGSHFSWQKHTSTWLQRCSLCPRRQRHSFRRDK